jgi:hypothetical protein
MHYKPLYSIFDMLQPLRRIHKMGVRTNGTNTERENMKHWSILSLWYPTLFAPRSATQLLASVLVSMSGLLVPARAQSAPICPPMSFPDTINLAKNPSFEVAGQYGGPFKVYLGSGVEESAALNWQVHSNGHALVTTELLPTTVPVGTDPAGLVEGQKRMLHVIARGSEGGVYQIPSSPPSYAMYSVWVFVKSGQVQMGVNLTNLGPVAWSEKHNEWEELRVCTADDYHHNMKTPVNWLFIYNQDQKGGEFYVDRVELRRTNAQ